MDPRIKNLKSTTFFGRRFTRRQIADIQQTVATFPALSRKELAQTICEHLHWRTPTGGNRVAAALGLLERLERAGILTLPAKRARNRRPRKPVALTPRTAPQPRIEDRMRDLLPLRLQLAAPEQTGLWNEFVQRHHYLGHKPLPGAQLRYFVLADDGLLLALLGFGAAAWKTAPRDQFIGWDPATRQRNLPLVVNHARYLILPWIRLPCLASHLLACIQRQLPLDWHRRYCLRPVLLETFCETPRFQGTCYRAANWIHLGQTQGRGKLDTHHQYAKPIKNIFVKPLCPDWKAILNR